MENSTEKRNTILLTIIAIATLLVTIVGATFAYFASNINTNSNIGVNVNTSNKQASFIATASGDISINVESYMMQQGDAGDGANNTSNNTDIRGSLVANANLNVNLTASDSEQITKCKYDIIFKWDTTSTDFTQGNGNENKLTDAQSKVSSKSIYPTKYYIRTQDSYETGFKELTISGSQSVSGQADGTTVTSDSIVEKNIDEFSKVNGSEDSIYLKQGETLATTGTATVDYQFEIKFYNLPTDQSSLMGKNFKGHIIVDNVVC